MKKVLFLLLIVALISLLSINAVKSESNKFCITDISPENLRPSDVSTVSITLKNIGTRSAYHVTTEILVDEKSPVSVVGRAKKSIETSSLNSLGCDREVIVHYDFYVDKDAKATVYPIQMRVIWSDEPEEKGEIIKINNETLYLGINEELLNFGIKVSGHPKEAKIDILNATTSPAKLKPGESGLLRIELKNVGSSTISSLDIRLLAETPLTPIDSDFDEHIEELRPGATATVCFNFAIDESADRLYYDLHLLLEYVDELGTYGKNTTIGIAVKGEPRILIQEIILEPSKLITDTEGIFMIRVINTGTESAEDVKLRISGADDILTEQHQFIGEIAPGESQTATFGVSVDKEAKIGKHGLKISISYEDKFGTSHSNFKIYEISIFASESFIPMEYLYVLIAIILLSVIGYVFITVRFKKEE